jgi:hypothetical protein
MRRDLMLLRARKAQTEARESAASQVGDAKAEAPSDVKVVDVEDLTMTDVPPPSRDVAPDQTTAEPAKSPQANGVPPVTTTADPPAPTALLPVTTAEAPLTTAAEAAPNTPTSGDGMKDTDFESMFGDLAGEMSPNNDTVNSIDMNDFPDTNADVSSLVPGLENYASMPDTTLPDTSVPEATTDSATALDASLDFSMPLMPGQDSISQDVNQTDTQGEDQQGDGTGQVDFGDNSFEDLFDMDYEFSTTAGNTDELDDWMKTWDN